MRFPLYLMLIAVLHFTACGPSDEDKARIKINLARTLLEQGDTLNALANLDSIPALYPKAAYSINAGKNLAGEVRFDLLHKKENMLDSLNVIITELEIPFEKQKTPFDRYTQYTHKRQTFERAWNRSYIQVHLDERGEMYISSNYYGKDWLNHTGLRVYDQGDDAMTDTIAVGDVNNHRSDFMEYKWEKVSYRNGADNGVIRFIAENANRRLKAVFLGKQYYYIILESYDKQAIKDALALSEAIRHKYMLESEIRLLEQNLQVN